MAVAWVGSHVGIKGNEQADQLATFGSHLGVISLKPRTATHEGIKPAFRGQKARDHSHAGFGIRDSDWHRHALSTLNGLS